MTNEPVNFGFAWKLRAGISPCLMAALHYSRERGGRTSRIEHPFWVLDYSHTDAGLTRVGAVSAAWRKRPGGIGHLYPPRTVYWEDSGDTRTVEGAYLLFSGGDVAGLHHLIRAPFLYGRFLDPDGILYRLLHQAASAGMAGEAGFWNAQAGLCRILDCLLEAEHQGAEDFCIGRKMPGTAKPDLVQALESYCRHHAAESVTLGHMARALDVSPSTLSHRYARLAGMSPMRALADIRINLAKSMLLRGLTLESIAAQTGFCDAFHLSKTFKRIVGQTPRDFIRVMTGKKGRNRGQAPSIAG